MLCHDYHNWPGIVQHVQACLREDCRNRVLVEVVDPCVEEEQAENEQHRSYYISGQEDYERRLEVLLLLLKIILKDTVGQLTELDCHDEQANSDNYELARKDEKWERSVLNESEENLQNNNRVDEPDGSVQQ